MVPVSNTPSIFVRSQLPAFFEFDGPALIQFLEYYYQWMEQSNDDFGDGNPVFATRKLNQYIDADLAPAKFYQLIRNQFMQDFPKTILRNEPNLLKNIKDFYRAKGSENAYRILFRILYDEEIEFYYPRKDILRLSDGKWVIRKSIQVNVPSLVGIDYSSFEITGKFSGATATIEEQLDYINKDGIQVSEMFLGSIAGEFQEGEEIIADGQILGTIVSAGIITYPGFYDGTDGFLSSDKKLEDNYYYQQFSYVLRSNETLNEYQDIAKKLVHPVGSLLFGEVVIDRVLAANVQFSSLFGQNIFEYIILSSYPLEQNCVVLTVGTPTVVPEILVGNLFFPSTLLENLCIPASTIIGNYSTNTIKSLGNYQIGQFPIYNQAVSDTFSTLTINGGELIDLNGEFSEIYVKVDSRLSNTIVKLSRNVQFPLFTSSNSTLQYANTADSIIATYPIRDFTANGSGTVKVSANTDAVTYAAQIANGDVSSTDFTSGKVLIVSGFNPTSESTIIRQGICPGDIVTISNSTFSNSYFVENAIEVSNSHYLILTRETKPNYTSSFNFTVSLTGLQQTT